MHRAAGVHHQIMLPGSPNFWTPLNPPPPQPPLAPPYMAAPPPPPVAGTHSQLSFSSFPPELFSLIEHPIPDCSFSHLLLGGLTGEDEKGSGISQFLAKKMDNWDTQFIKQESLYTNNRCNNNNNEEQFQQVHGNENHSYNSSSNNNSWSQMIPATSSPQSCITTNFNPNMLDFASNNSSEMTNHRHNIPSPLATSRSSECNSNTPSGGAPKKAKVQPPSSTPTTIKVRKEKLGDRITALHQLVSPFGKTDTASVLLEAIGYIRFLQSQIEALSLPYLSGGSGNRRQTHPVKSGEKNSMFPEDPGQLLNENCLKRKGCLDQESYEEPEKDLRSRGLCLVPVSCTLHVGSENAADYWAPAFNAAFR